MVAVPQHGWANQSGLDIDSQVREDILVVRNIENAGDNSVPLQAPLIYKAASQRESPYAVNGTDKAYALVGEFAGVDLYHMAEQADEDDAAAAIEA
jgi:hypothetical protein